MLFLTISNFLVFILLQVPFPLVLSLIIGVIDAVPGIGATLGIGTVFFILLTQDVLLAKAVVVAIPAPQALMLLEPLAETGLPAMFIDNLRCVEFDPCVSVIAGYPAQLHQPGWKAVSVLDDPDLAWIGLDSSKRIMAGQSSVFVVNSSAEFAQSHLEAQDLHPAGVKLLKRASECLLPWLDTPDWMQVHRWRYAFPRHPWHEAYLSAGTLVCCGDWCGGNQVESAMLSGLAAAEQINNQLQKRSLPGANFFDLVNHTDNPS